MPAASYPEACEDANGGGFAVSFWLYLPVDTRNTRDIISHTNVTDVSDTLDTVRITGAHADVQAGQNARKLPQNAAECQENGESLDALVFHSICCRPVEDDSPGVTLEQRYSHPAVSLVTSGNLSNSHNNSSSNSSSSSSSSIKTATHVRFSILTPNCTVVNSGIASPRDTRTSYIEHSLTSDTPLPHGHWLHVACIYDCATTTTKGTSDRKHAMRMVLNGYTIAEHAVETAVTASAPNLNQNLNLNSNLAGTTSSVPCGPLCTGTTVSVEKDLGASTS